MSVDSRLSPPVLPYAARGTNTIPLTSGGLDMLRQTRPWVTFVSSVMAVMGLLAAAVGVGGLLMSFNRRPGQVPVFAVYIILALVYLFPANYLRKYAQQIKVLMQTESSHHLEAALEAQKSFWRVVGILTAITVALYGGILLLAVSAVGMRGLFR